MLARSSNIVLQYKQYYRRSLRPFSDGVGIITNERTTRTGRVKVEITWLAAPRPASQPARPPRAAYGCARIRQARECVKIFIFFYSSQHKYECAHIHVREHGTLAHTAPLTIAPEASSRVILNHPRARARTLAFFPHTSMMHTRTLAHTMSTRRHVSLPYTRGCFTTMISFVCYIYLYTYVFIVLGRGARAYSEFPFPFPPDTYTHRYMFVFTT